MRFPITKDGSAPPSKVTAAIRAATARRVFRASLGASLPILNRKYSLKFFDEFYCVGGSSVAILCNCVNCNILEE